MVTAYEMQNKFLNKELLELNQLKQQAIEREQKIFQYVGKTILHEFLLLIFIINLCSISQDWEAKFYQIQSKYLLLLNELHNPQVGVSASRKEMVSQLLKDIVEADGKKPNLQTDSESYDRFFSIYNSIIWLLIVKLLYLEDLDSGWMTVIMKAQHPWKKRQTNCGDKPKINFKRQPKSWYIFVSFFFAKKNVWLVSHILFLF